MCYRINLNCTNYSGIDLRTQRCVRSVSDTKNLNNIRYFYSIMNLRKINLIVLIFVLIIASVSLIGDIVSSFGILKLPIQQVKYSNFIGLNLILARIVTFIAAILIFVFLVLILLVSMIHRKDNAPWTTFFLMREKAGRFIKEIELSLIFGLVATVVFAVNATILSFLAYGLVISFWVLAITMSIIAIFSIDLYTTYFRRFI